MLNQRITFDLFIRGLIVVAIIVLSIFMVGRLSTVLIPFFVAWLLAYMLYPLVCFLQYKARLRSRILSIVAALLVVFSVIIMLVVLFFRKGIFGDRELPDLIGRRKKVRVKKTKKQEVADHE